LIDSYLSTYLSRPVEWEKKATGRNFLNQLYIALDKLEGRRRVGRPNLR
jgi:hypothetical protein